MKTRIPRRDVLASMATLTVSGGLSVQAASAKMKNSQLLFSSPKGERGQSSLKGTLKKKGNMLIRQMITSSFILFMIMPVCVGKDFYISVSGNDNRPGTKEQPFATFAHARDQVRQWNQANATENISIWISAGEYRFSETLVFGLEDSAKPGQTITYAAMPGSTPVINSDVTIAGWHKLNEFPEGLPDEAKGRIWVATVPESASHLKTVYHSKGMLPRASTEAIAHQRTGRRGRSGTDEYYKTIPFLKGTTEELFNPQNAEISVIPVSPWTMNILPVDSVDDATGMVYLGAYSTYALARPWMSLKTLWVENTFVGLDEPGEWVFDASEKLLYYWPVDNKKPGNDIVVPQLIEMIRIEGQIDYNGSTDTPVKGLNFKGITFTHGNRFESAGRTGLGLQHDWERFDESTALIRFRGAENCRVENCIFIHSGGAGIRLDLHAQNIKIINNEFSELGGGGVLLVGYGPGTKDVNKNNEISNNLIHHIGRLWWHSIGIFAWQSGNNLISHNSIHHVPYTAIAVTGRIRWDRSGVSECSKTIRWAETADFTGRESWEEREQFLHGRKNIIENNDIHHVMGATSDEKGATVWYDIFDIKNNENKSHIKGLMHDGNGIYISGTGSGNIVRGNYVHDTPSVSIGEGIRCDNDQHETTFTNNIVYRFGAHGIGFTSKGRNHIFNNIVACPPTRVIRGLLSLESGNNLNTAGSRVFNNIIYATYPNQPLVSMQIKQASFFDQGPSKVMASIEIDRNIYFNTADPSSADAYLKWARENGREEKSIQEDPLFLDIENGNFQLKPNSPAIELGFKPFVLNAGRITGLKITLGMLGVSPLKCTDQVKTNEKIVVDGSAYEGLSGYFPLILCDNLSSSIVDKVTFVGFGEREPAVIVLDDGLWLRLIAPPAVSDKLCSLAPASTATTDYSNSVFSSTRALVPTGSIWGSAYDESVVMDTRLEQKVSDGGSGESNRSWEMTVGRGGQIASFRIPSMGETVPPQWWKNPSTAPWMDEVWQSVAIDTKLNNSINRSPNFIHQAGVYPNQDDALKEAFYSPMVAAHVNEADRSFMAINWGQQAHLKIYTNNDTADDWRSDLLYYTNIRDLGQGLIEVSQGYYNYGADMPNWFNMPWGGVRRTSTEYAFFSEPSGSGWTDAQGDMFGSGAKMIYDVTGGTIAWSASKTGNTPCLGLVFGHDPNPLLPYQIAKSMMRYGYAGGDIKPEEDTWRNYHVVSGIRQYSLSQGRGVWSRYYFVLGDDLDDLEKRIKARKLTSEPSLMPFDYTEDSNPLIGYSYAGSGENFRITENGATPQFFLYAYPINNSFPIYEIIEKDKSRHLTWDPYATGVIKTYDGTIAGIRLLGFARRAEDVEGSSFTYQLLDVVMANAQDNYIASGKALSVRIASTANTLPAKFNAAREERLEWWRDAKLGLFIHWGPASVAGVEISWARMDHPFDHPGHQNMSTEEYDNLYTKFNPVKFDADAWMRLAKEAGFKYVVFTAKHHDGFSNWHTQLRDYNIANTPFKRDICKELSDAAHKYGIRLGWYYSTRDWSHPDYLVGDNEKYNAFYEGQIRELLTDYGKVDIMWFDHVAGNWGDYTILELFDMMYSLQGSDLLVNNRAAKFIKKEKGKTYGPGTPELESLVQGDFDTPEQKIGKFQTDRAWESCMTMTKVIKRYGGGWSYRPDGTTIPYEEVINTLVQSVTGDGNLLLNVGPLPTGEFPADQIVILKRMGQWLNQYGESIYGTRGGPVPNGKWGGTTHSGNKIYVHILNWPEDGSPLVLSAPDIRIAQSKGLNV